MFIPESPRWLAQRGRWDESRKVLQKFGGAEYADSALAEIRRAFEAGPGRSLLSILKEPKFRRVMVIGIVLAVLRQWCGINVIFNYAQEIFASGGFAVSDTLFNIVITGVVNCVFTLLALFTVERLGRRRLMLVGCSGLAIIYLLLGGCYVFGLQGVLLVPLVMAAIACYAMTLAPMHLGGSVRDLSRGSARGLHGGCHDLAVDGLLHPDLYVPAAQCGSRDGAYLLDLRRDLRGRLPLHLQELA
jgi:SP family sugar porter-like MFS transporter